MWIKKHADDAGGRRKLRFSKPLWGASLIAAAVLALGVNGTLGQFVAQITNDNNHVTTAAFSFSESNVITDPDGTTTVVNPPCATAEGGQTATCSDINKYGDEGADATPMVPGDQQSTTVQLKNTSMAPNGLAGNLALDVADCQNANTPDAPAGRTAGDLCSVIEVHIVCSYDGQTFELGTAPDATSGTPVTLTDLATQPTEPIPIVTDVLPGDDVDCAFTTYFPITATETSGLQDVQISQDLTWIFTSV